MKTSWMNVTAEQFTALQVGKTYRIDGRKGRVIAKSESSGKLATGMASFTPMVQVEWKE